MWMDCLCVVFPFENALFVWQLEVDRLQSFKLNPSVMCLCRMPIVWCFCCLSCMWTCSFTGLSLQFKYGWSTFVMLSKTPLWITVYSIARLWKLKVMLWTIGDRRYEIILESSLSQWFLETCQSLSPVLKVNQMNRWGETSTFPQLALASTGFIIHASFYFGFMICTLGKLYLGNRIFRCKKRNGHAVHVMFWSTELHSSIWIRCCMVQNLPQTDHNPVWGRFS